MNVAIGRRAVPGQLVRFPDPFGRRSPATQRQEQPVQEILFVLPPLFHISSSGGNLFKNRPRASTSEYEQPPINLRLFQNTVKFLDNFFLSKKAEIRK